MRIALAEAAGRLSVQGGGADAPGPASERPVVQCACGGARALQALKVSNMDEVMKIAVADADPNVRRAALGILPSLPLSDAAKVQSLASVIRGGAVNDQQAGFEVLGTLKSAEAEKALGSFFDELVAGKVAPAVQLDLVDAMQASGSPALEAKLDGVSEDEGGSTPSSLAFRDALLQGGSVDARPRTSLSRTRRRSARAATRCATPDRMSVRTSRAWRRG